MVNYEGMFVIDVNGNKESAKDGVQWLSEAIGKQGGHVDHVNEWGMRRLAYPVKKRYEAYYVVMDFKMDPANVQPVEGQCLLNEKILKHMILKKITIRPRKTRTRKKAQTRPSDEKGEHHG